MAEPAPQSCLPTWVGYGCAVSFVPCARIAKADGAADICRFPPAFGGWRTALALALNAGRLVAQDRQGKAIVVSGLSVADLGLGLLQLRLA